MAHKDLPPRMQYAPAERLRCPRLRFHTNSHLVRPDSLVVLLRALVWSSLPEHENKRMVVTGHTDSAGSEEDNLALSTRRAENVHYLLTGKKDEWVDSALESYTISKSKADIQEIRYLAPSAPKVGDPAWNDRDTWSKVWVSYVRKLAKWCGANHAPPLLTGIYPHTDETGHLPSLGKMQMVQRERLLLPEDDAVFGCGETFLIDLSNNGVSIVNRRIEILWFEDDARDSESNALLVPWENPETGEIERPQVGSPEDVKAAAEGIFPDDDGWGWDLKPVSCPQSLIDVPSKSVLVIDLSGSMKSAVSAGGLDTTRLEASKQMLENCLMALNVGDRFAVVGFGSEVLLGGVYTETVTNNEQANVRMNDQRQPTFRSDEDAAKNARPLRLLRVTEDLQRDMVDWVRWLPYFGGTNLWGGLQRALAVDGAKKIVLLSDGGPSAGDVNERYIVDTALERARSAGITIEAYGFVTGTPTEAELAECDRIFESLAGQEPRASSRQLIDRTNRSLTNAFLTYFLKKLSSNNFQDLTQTLNNLRAGVSD